MKSWQDKGMPYYGSNYNALTHHTQWDGRTHYWTGMAVKGFEEQDPDKPNCCHDMALFEPEEVSPDRRALKSLRLNLRAKGHSHRAICERLGQKLSFMRMRLYGERPFKKHEFNALCRMVGLNPDNLLRKGRGE